MASKKDTSKVKEQIDENLKRVYHDALQEKLPDRFLALIAELRAKEQRQTQEQGPHGA